MKLVKGAWALLVGIKDALVLLAMLAFFGALYAILSASPNPRGGKDGALLLALDGTVVEQRETLDPRDLLFGQSPVGKQYPLSDILQALKAAERDDDIKTVVLDLDSFPGGGQVAMENIAEALDGVKAAGKPVLAFATGYSDDSYLLAAHASEVWLDPMGAAAFAGPGGSRLYFKGLIDRLAVNVHVYRVGKYKSFVEPYTRSEQSPEAKSANEALAGALWSNWIDNVAKARPKARIADFVVDPVAGLKAAGGSLSQAALSAGLVDRLGDRTAFDKRVAAIAGSDDYGPAGNFHYSALKEYVAAHPASRAGRKIGIVTVAGDIVDGKAPAGTAGGDTISDLIAEALAEHELKALVVRVDSPGGSALAAEKIRLALAEAKAQGLPVVASMGNVAASGG
jgi:protease-4